MSGDNVPQVGSDRSRGRIVEAFRWIDVPVFLAFGVFVVFRWQWSVRYLLGMGIAVGSFALWMTARFQLGESFAVRPQAKKLVTTGLYSRFRHPIYFFGALAYAGLIIAWGQLVWLLGLFPASLWQVWRARKERAVLEQAFGEEYRRYRASTWF